MRLHWLLPTRSGIPVLMYHRVWPGRQDGLTLTPEQLRAQWEYLKMEGYQALSMQAFLRIARGEDPVPKRAVLLTFDDGYRNNLTYVYPLLQELGWCATIFLIGDTLAEKSRTQTPEELDRKLSVEELLGMDRKIIQLGFHGFHHENFAQSKPEAVRRAMEQSFQAFRQAGIPFEPVLAYPYGARPEDPQQAAGLKRWLAEQGLIAAFRIGNRPAAMPAPDLFDIRRIDIRGEDSLEDFRIKLRKGKLKPF